MNKVTILGVNISQIKTEQAIETVDKWMQEKARRYIVTPNPEILVLAQKDNEFKEILNKADMAIPDGAGLLWANSNLKERVSGTDLMIELCDLAEKKEYVVGLFGARGNVCQQTIKKLKLSYPKLQISDLNNLSNPSDISVDLLFVAFGAPKQEKFIYNQKIARVAMGVGGAFDLISGKIRRAPKWMQNTGFEWLWRLMMEPRRLKRIITAIIIFPYLIIKSKIKMSLRTK